MCVSVVLSVLSGVIRCIPRKRKIDVSLDRYGIVTLLRQQALSLGSDMETSAKRMKILFTAAASAAAVIVARAIYKRSTRDDDDEPFPLLPITSAATVTKMAELPLCAGDIFVCSYPKSGTTWMQHIVHTLATNGRSPLPHISDACPFYDVDRSWAAGDGAVLSEVVRSNHAKIFRRIFNTHLRWRMMPKSHEDARYVYMTRRAEDTCFSFFEHLSHQALEDGGYSGTLDEFITEWTSGQAPFGSWSAHINSWLPAGSGGQPADPRVLVVSYEELKADLRGNVLRVNEHCGFGLSEARIDELLPRFEFSWMRAHEAEFNPRSVRWLQTPGASEAEAFHFIRAGRVGDGERPFASNPKHREALRAMVARTYGGQPPPPHVAKLLPSVSS